MSLVAVQSAVPLQLLEPRKRTSSFSYPRPAKAPRVAAEMGAPLRRTESYISLTDFRPTTTTTTRRADQPIPYSRSLQFYKDQRDRERRKTLLNRATEPITIVIRTDPSPRSTRHSSKKSLVSPPAKSPPPAAPAPNCALPAVPISPRHSSPLAPTRTPLPSRPLFPRSKPEPDLYRKALKTSMKGSPEGQKILRMGPRLAVSIMTATKELERIVAAQESEPQDVLMADPYPIAQVPAMTKSWVVVQGEDWEMVDCAA